MGCPETMKAAVLFGFNDVRIVERPRPPPGPDEVLIKVKSCGVCAGDIKMITRGMLKQPPFGEFIIGHEYAGTVVQVGETIDEFAIGDRVAVDIVFLAHLDDPVTADIGLAVQKGNGIFTVRGEGRMSVSQAFSLMAQGKIMAEELVTHRFPLSRINEAINTFVERRNGAIKVVVHP